MKSFIDKDSCVFCNHTLDKKIKGLSDLWLKYLCQDCLKEYIDKWNLGKYTDYFS